MDNVNIKKLVDQNAKFESRVKNLLIEKSNSFDSLIELYSILNNIYPSYIAPVYHLNRYHQLVNDSFSIDLFDSLESKQRDAMLQIEFQDTLIAIKGLLDRIVKIVSIHYKNLESNLTFGFYDLNTGKRTKFMKNVLQMADEDEFMNRILNEYKDWIHKAVGPRDKVVHYNDLPFVYRATFDPSDTSFKSMEIVHLNKDLYEGVDLEDNNQIRNIGFDYNDLVKFINRLYELYDLTVNTIIDKFK
ncbi:MAG: hypothetical protein H7239_08310 [Flavobacterium sp.]|nr:hypothetical protein [Flavobacterium sp.]